MENHYKNRSLRQTGRLPARRVIASTCPKFAVTLLMMLFSMSSVARADQVAHITVTQSDVQCRDDVVKVSHIATIDSTNRQVTAAIAALDLDKFDASETAITVTQDQLRIRLALAGFDTPGIVLAGADQVRVQRMKTENIASAMETVLRNRLADQYQISQDDLVVTLNSNTTHFKDQSIDPTTMHIVTSLPAELPLGQRSIAVELTDAEIKTVEVRLNARIAVVRNLVVATRAIRKGETMNSENVESVRRPIDNRSVRFASFEQVVGQQSRVDVNQYDLIKSTTIRTTASRSDFAVRKNALINVVVRRGPLEVVLKGARAIDAGNPGDQIALLNPHTREQIVARIIDGSTAEVRY